MGVFNKQANTTQPVKGSRPWLEQQNQAARANLLAVVAFTLVNIVLLFTESNSYFLFSASLPYFLAGVGRGLQPLSGAASPLILGLFAGAAVVVVLYVLCWALWKKHVAWSIVSLALFAIDCGFMVWCYVGVSGQELAEVGIDAAFHLWVLFYLINGVRSGLKLRKLTAEEQPVTVPQEVSRGPEF